MAVIRVITANEQEVVEIVWTLRDSTQYVERHRIPPRNVVLARQREQGVSGTVETKAAVSPLRPEGEASE